MKKASFIALLVTGILSFLTLANTIYAANSGWDYNLTKRCAKSPYSDQLNYYQDTTQCDASNKNWTIAVQSEKELGISCSGVANQSLPINQPGGPLSLDWIPHSDEFTNQNWQVNLSTDFITKTNPCGANHFTWYTFMDHVAHNGGPFALPNNLSTSVTARLSQDNPNGATRAFLGYQGYWDGKSHGIEINFSHTDNWGDADSQPDIITSIKNPTLEFISMDGKTLGLNLNPGETKMLYVRWIDIIQSLITRGYLTAPSGGWNNSASTAVYIGTEVNNFTSTNAAKAILTVTNFRNLGLNGLDGDVDIQQQINNLPSTGGTVNLPSGEYLLSTANGSAENFPDGTPIQTAILINKDNVTLEGQGSSTILKLAPHVKMRALSITSKNVTVKNLTIDGNKTQRNGSVPWPNGDVVDALLYSSSTASDITIENVEVKDGIEDGIGFWKTQNVLSQNNYSHDNGTPQAGGAGISLSGVTNARAISNRIENNSATGIWSAFDANNVQILNNTIRNNASGGITIGGGTAANGLGVNNSGFEIKNNILSGNGSAGFATITIFASKNGILDHNKIESSQFDNIQIDGTSDIFSTNWNLTYNQCASTPGIRNLGYSQEIVLMGNSCQTNIPQLLSGDINLDGHIDIFDYNIMVSKFGHPYTIFDYNQLVANFGKSL